MSLSTSSANILRTSLILAVVLFGCQSKTVSQPETPQPITNQSAGAEAVTFEPRNDDGELSKPYENPPPDSWAGSYTFTEAHTEGEQTMTWVYDLNLFRRKDGSWAGDLNVDGFQTSKRLRLRGELEGDKMQVILDGYREGNMFEAPLVGTTLFTLEEASQEGARTIVTTWDSLKPNLPSTPEVGISFKKL